MNNEYHAVVHLFGKNSSDKQEFVRKVIPGQEVEIGLNLYKEVNRVLNFYGVGETESFLGRVAFDTSIDMATASSEIDYKTKENFYFTASQFLNLTVVNLINRKLLVDKKPLLIPDSFKISGSSYTDKSVLNAFTVVSEFYEFSNAFGTYAGEGENRVTWIPPLNFYATESGHDYVRIIKSWIFALRDVIRIPAVKKKLCFTETEIDFINAFIKSGKDLDISGKNPDHEGELMRWIMKKSMEEKGVPSNRVASLLIWENHYNR